MNKLIFKLAFLFAILLSGCKKEADIIQKDSSNNNSSLEKGKGIRFEEINNRLQFKECECYDPVGGGIGYTNQVTSGDYILSAFESGNPKSPQQLYIELVDIINAASSGNVIYIEPECVIEVSAPIVINFPLTLAGGRGLLNNVGATIYPASGFNGNVLVISSDNVRITGFTFQGGGNDTWGIRAYGVKRVEIDNNDLYNWVDAIQLSETNNPPPNEKQLLDTKGFLIHNNYIHDNYFHDGNGNPRGYGILVDNAYPILYANIFNYNRHDIAGVGWMKSGYEVKCNIFLDQSYHNQANIDMHDCSSCDQSTESYKLRTSGGFMHIHHNEFRELNRQATIYPVGKPSTLCLIENNIFKANTIYNEPGSSNPAITQQPWNQPNSPNLYGNIVAINNIYDQSYLGWYVRDNWDYQKTDNLIRIPSTNDLLHAALNPILGPSWIYKLSQKLDYTFGDFDGDGVTDIYKTDGAQWYFLPLNTGYTDAWIPLASSTYALATIFINGSNGYLINNNLVLGNFDSDNKTDILVTTGSSWLVSYGAISAWSNYVTSGYTTANTLWGKFYNSGYNNHITDAFISESNNWKISYDGTSWQNVNYSSYPFSNFKVGDLNGDTHADIFLSYGNDWWYSSNATSSWIFLNNSNLSPNDIILGDFNSDNTSDVIGAWSGNWWVSLGGTGSWTDLNTSNFPLSNFSYGSLY